MKRIIVILSIVLIINNLKAQSGQGEAMYVGDSEDKIVRIMKSLVAEDPSFSYHVQKDWDKNFNDYTTLHKILINNKEGLYYIMCFRNKAIYIITFMPVLCGTKVDETILGKYRNSMRGSLGKSQGMEYLSDGVYKYAIAYPASYFSMISFITDVNTRMTYMFNTYSIESLKSLRDLWINEYKNSTQISSIVYL
jgi:hypothetical protein